MAYQLSECEHLLDKLMRHCCLLSTCPAGLPPAGYLRIFRLLWTIKHVEAVLGQCWDAINTAQRALAALRAQERLHGVAVDNVELVGGGGWRLRRCTAASTAHSEQ